jgi:cytoskeletal protein CcmA (bactofilin family)
MFRRETPPAGRIDTLVARNTRLHGDIHFTGGLHLDGRVQGNVRSEPGTTASLSVSEHGSVEGSVDVPVVVLNGTVKGDIRARERVVLGAHATVHGNVYYGVIEMEMGAQVCGKLIPAKPESAPTAGATPQPAAAAT